MARRWISFSWDTAAGKGIVRSEEDWKKVILLHGGNLKRLKNLKSNRCFSNDLSFGECLTYTQSPTLGEWAEQNNQRMFPNMISDQG